YVAGSLNDRLKDGRVRPQDVGFPKGHVPAYGEPLPEPFLETTTKLERVDRELSRDEAIRISGLTPAEYDGLLVAVVKIDETVNTVVGKRGLVHVDGKKEFAMD